MTDRDRLLACERRLREMGVQDVKVFMTPGASYCRMLYEAAEMFEALIDGRSRQSPPLFD